MNLRMFRDPKSSRSKDPAGWAGTTCQTKATACKYDVQALAYENVLKSEDGEDRCLLTKYFEGICDGTYLDLGAVDGVHHSNTYAMYKLLGWTGVNVEIDPTNFERLIVNRPNDIANVNVAVCSESDGVHYAPSPDNIALGGIWEFSSEANREEKWPGVTEYHTIPTKCTPLQSVLDASVSAKGKKYYFDFASIDIEGSEISALYGIDYDRISFGLILLEKNGNDDTNRQVHELLSSKGYDEVTQPCGGQNLMYVNRSFHRIYAKLRNQNFQLRGSS